MRRHAIVATVVALLALLVLFARPGSRADDTPAKVSHAFGLARRVPWTTSRIIGSPDPLPPYRIARAFPKLTFKNPLLMTRVPGTSRLCVGEQAGKIYSFPNQQNVAKADLFFDAARELHSWDRKPVKGVGNLYGLAFHPQFAKNRYCYVCYVLDSTKEGEQLPNGSRVSRFRVTNTNPPRIDPASEKILITWLAGGHNGGDLHFGPDGYLYISTGDAANPNPPDVFNTGQDISDLLSSILRIDVDHEANGKPYTIPADNPFIKTPGARPEVYAYGFRNPWRMSFDRQTGDLWVGDVGWELWEMIDRVKKGGNYGWSIMEGPQPVHPDGKRGPTSISPPNLAFPHTEAASITGGYVYRGKRHPELQGVYLCGDWVTRKVWGTRFDGDRIVWHKELAQGNERVVAFGEDNDGEVYILNYDDVGTIHQLEKNDTSKDNSANFPRRLSETGLFTSIENLNPAPGVLPFSVNAAQWADYAGAERWIALPGTTTVKAYDNPVAIPGGFFSGQIFFPENGVLAKTISLEMERGNPASRRRLETQVLHFDGTTWHGYTYAWNDAQTDAMLVPASGTTRTFMVKDVQAPGGQRRQTWHFHSRTECLQCHNPWAGYTLAFTLPQLNRAHRYGSLVDHQIRALEQIGVLQLLAAKDNQPSPGKPKPPGRLTNPYDAGAPLNERARSYLQVNCAHCHQFGAGGTADIDLRYDFPIEETKTLDVRPVQGAFDIADARILAPGDPYRSVLYYRMSKLGGGRMPHIGSDYVDVRGVRLLHDWIRQLPLHKDERALLGKLTDLHDFGLPVQEREEWPDLLRRTAEGMARAHGRTKVIPEDTQQAERALKAQAMGHAQARASERKQAIAALLSTPTGALILVHALDEKRIPTWVQGEVLQAAGTAAGPVRDLFERFIPDDQRVARLGPMIKPQQILTRRGDIGRGRDLFFNNAGLQCVKCHRVGSVGSTLGPDLSQIGKKYTRGLILENILEPSKTIDPKYVAYLVVMDDGKQYTGLVATKTATEVVLRTSTDQELHLPLKRVEQMRSQKTSLMPEQLLRDLTAQQAADLLEFLASLK